MGLRLGGFVDNQAARSQSVEEFESCPVQPRFHCSNRVCDHLGNLLVRAPLLVIENEDGSVVGPEVVDSGANLTRQLDRVVCRAVVGRFMEVVGELGASRPSAGPGPASVYRNPEDPGAEGSNRVPPVETAKNAQKNLLNNVFGIMAMAEETHAKPKHVLLESLDQFPRGNWIACEATADDRGV